MSVGGEVLAGTQLFGPSASQDSAQWQTVLTALGIVRPQAVRRVTEAALLGGVIEQGVDERLVILSDGAPQFNVLVHALCWVHAERALRRLQGNTSQQRQNIEEMQQQLWHYYQQLKTYPQTPTADRKRELEQTFDQLFGRCFLHHASLNTVLPPVRGGGGGGCLAEAGGAPAPLPRHWDAAPHYPATRCPTPLRPPRPAGRRAPHTTRVRRDKPCLLS